MIRMFNSGAGTVTTTVGRLNPGCYLDVPEMEARKLMGMYAHLKDAEVMIGKAPVAAVAPVAAPEPKVPASAPKVEVKLLKKSKRKKR
jgi:hypothetical protein